MRQYFFFPLLALLRIIGGLPQVEEKRYVRRERTAFQLSFADRPRDTAESSPVATSVAVLTSTNNIAARIDSRMSVGCLLRLRRRWDRVSDGYTPYRTYTVNVYRVSPNLAPPVPTSALHNNQKLCFCEGPFIPPGYY